MTTPTLYVLVGIPGSGKSTWVENQEWAKDCAYISTDKLVEEEAKRQGSTYNDVFHDYMKKATLLMCEEVYDARDQEKSIIWDQTSTTIKSRAKKLRMLPNYKKIAVVFKVPEAEELNRRLANRPGKTIPKNVVDQMINGFVTPTEEEGFDEIWYT